ncbi:MAG TPA: alpha/beta hydrolase [Burkholderiaceae bacterium]|nr:alpha/beta hydrolase [Burkholderiaceae bacterium]
MSIYGKSPQQTIDSKHPSVVFIHGVLNDHSVWDAILTPLTEAFSSGMNAMAIDLPGHGRSTGHAPASVEQAADTLLALLDSAGIESAALVGHSFGSLIALEAAARAPSRVTHLALLGTASPMRVSPVLLEASVNDPMAAIDMVNNFSFSQKPPPPPDLMQHVFAQSQNLPAQDTATNIFHTGLNACNTYQNATTAIAKVTAPLLFIMGDKDKMTPPKAAQVLIDAALQAGQSVKQVNVNAGHAMMVEASNEVVQALQSFLQK